jgi:hypothetical protein
MPPLTPENRVFAKIPASSQILFVVHACHTIRSGVSDLIQHCIALGHWKRLTHSGGPQASDGDAAISFPSSASCSDILSAVSAARESA